MKTKPTIQLELGPWLAAALLLCSAVAHAQEEILFDRVSLQAEASREVENDRMRAVLVVQEEGSDPARLADRINRTMRWALDEVGETPAVTAETGGYRTEPIYRKGTLSHWRAVQSLRLESRDFTALSEVIGDLQERLQVQSMGFEVSDEARREAENALIDEALAAFEARADRVQKNLNAGGWRIINLNIGTQGGGPRPVYRMEAMADRAGPAVEAGTSTVTVNVSGSIQLLPGKP